MSILRIAAGLVLVSAIIPVNPADLEDESAISAHVPFSAIHYLARDLEVVCLPGSRFCLGRESAEKLARDSIVAGRLGGGRSLLSLRP